MTSVLILRRVAFVLLMLVLSGGVWMLRTKVPATARWLENAELRLIDARFLLRGPRPPAYLEKVKKEVTIVAMNDTISRRYGRILPRSLHAQLVKQLKKDGAKAVIFDVLFIDPDARDPRGDAEFAAAVRAANNVYLPFDHDSADATAPAVEARLKAKLALPFAPVRENAAHLQTPYPALFAAMRGGGHVATKADSDSKYRNAILLLESDAVYPHVALDAVAVAAWGAKRGDWKREGDFLVVGDHRIGPLQRATLNSETGNDANLAWTMPLDFIGGRQVMEQLTIPYEAALSGTQASRIKNHIVIIGDYASGTRDLRSGPFDTNDVFLGVQTNATLIANLLDNNFLRESRFGLALTLGCGFLAGMVALSLRTSWSLPATFALGLVMLIVSMVAFVSANVLLETTAPLLALALNYTAFSAYRLTNRDRSARESEMALLETQTLLGQIVNPRLAREMASSPEARLNLAIGARREISVLFCDIRGFTPWSETQAPEEVKARLDEYFPTMCEICEDDFDGFIDKFIGDAIMVVWNAHKDHPDHAQRATRAALSMQRALIGMNDGWRRQGVAEFEIGIGVASGPAIFGTFGAPGRKVQPTVLGDTVNLAARLESLTKQHGPVLVSQGTFDALGEDFECRSVGNVEVKGKAETQAVYVVTGARRVKA